MVEMDKTKSQKPKIESVNQNKEHLKSRADLFKVEMCLPFDADKKFKICDPNFEFKICDPIIEKFAINKDVCTPSKVSVVITHGEEVINPSEELVAAVKSLTYEVQELKKKIEKN